MMEINPLMDCGFMDWIRMTYPVSFIGIILTAFGAAIGAFANITVIKSLERQIERCH